MPSGTHTYVYSPTGQLISANGYSYTYDGKGHRVAKSNGSVTTLYWRDISGKTLVETTGTADLMLYMFISMGSLLLERAAAYIITLLIILDHFAI
jgi:hypothetical protein